MFLLRLLILISLALNIFANDEYINSLTLAKVKKLVEKEEEIAVAYKKYISEKGTNKVTNNLITVSNLRDLNYLPRGFNLIDPFGRETQILTNHKISSFTSSDRVLKSNLYDYYYSNKYRTYTKAPLKFNKNNNDDYDEVEILLSSDEKYKMEFEDDITTDKNNLGEFTGYYLDDKAVLHWYEKGNYKFSLGNDLIVDKNVSVLNDNGTISSIFLELIKSKNFMYAGQKILREGNNNSVEQYLNTEKNLVDLNPTKSVGKTLMRFSNSGGGLIINGDIFTWGNNTNKTVSIGNNSYTDTTGNSGTGNLIVNTMINAKAIVYDDSKEVPYTNNFNNKHFHSSPLRANFIDFFSEDTHSTCGITIKGELYCGGEDVLENNYIEFSNYLKGTKNNMEYLYRSTFFNGITNKAKTIIAIDNTYLVLSRVDTDTVDGYILYFWGKDNLSGWAGTGNKTETNIFVPTKSSEIRFKDITYTESSSFRKILGLNTVGNLYIWGLSNGGDCSETSVNSYCNPIKIDSTVNFSSIVGGRKYFKAVDNSGNFYRISTSGVITSVESIIKENKYAATYDETNDARILSVDFSKDITDSSDGIVWVNSNNQLKGNYKISSIYDALFENAISQIKWKDIRVISDDNAMCGIDVNDQMYCWGNMVNPSGTGWILPLFNANLHDENKDFLLVEKKSGSITTMTSGTWLNNSKFYIKYPTYIGGFNYEFIFK
ncbi:MAG: hypothetical protein PHY66_00605 [Aliarcobacter sp.]|nr:hypothetical protein [Aliarcobacter sp.]